MAQSFHAADSDDVVEPARNGHVTGAEGGRSGRATRLKRERLHARQTAGMGTERRQLLLSFQDAGRHIAQIKRRDVAGIEIGILDGGCDGLAGQV